ncbi:MAG: flagellar biosynthetic protein FliO [Planctomycetota bacterium]
MERGCELRPAVPKLFLLSLCVVAIGLLLGDRLGAQEVDPGKADSVLEKAKSSTKNSAKNSAKRAEPAAARTLEDILRRSRTSPAAEGGDEIPQRSKMEEYFRLLGWLLVVVVLAVASIYFLKRLMPGASSARSSQLIEVVARSSLTPKHQLLVVRVAERAMVIGISPEGITRVAEMNDPREVMQTSATPSFENQLAREKASYPLSQKREERSPALYGKEIDRLKSMVANWRHAALRKERSS